jgi:hypothetical protein
MFLRVSLHLGKGMGFREAATSALNLSLFIDQNVWIFCFVTFASNFNFSL